MAVAYIKAHTNVQEKVLDTSASVTVDTGGIAAGNLIVLAMVFDNAGTASKPVISSITKMSGETNSWALLGAARSTSTSIGAFSSGELWAIKTTVAWTAGTYTITLDTAVTMKAARFVEFSGAEATLRSTAATAYSTTTTAASATTTGTTPVIGDLAVGFMFHSNTTASLAGDTDTTGGTWAGVDSMGSTGGSGTTNNFGAIQYKILTGANQQTYNNSAAMTAGNGSIVAVLQATPEPAITQAAYRLYADGTETGSTALAAQDTGYTADLTSGDVNLQVRVRLQETGVGPVPATDDWQLQWEKNTSGTWTSVAPGLIEYTTLNSLSGGSIATVGAGYGQSFLGNGQQLTSAELRLRWAAAVTGNITVELFAHTGTFGSGGTGTGTALAVSTARARSSLTGTYAWESFTFDGTYTLTAGTPYVIAFRNGSGSTGAVDIETDGAGTAPGNQNFYNGTTWSSSTADALFKVHTTEPTNVVPYVSTLLDNTAPSTNRLTGGTGSFTAGDVTEDGVANDQGWPTSNHTEMVYSVTLKAADLADDDVLRFRVLRNGATTGFTYTQYPTVTVLIGAGVPSGTGTGSYAFNRTTATGYKLPQGSTTTGTYAFNRTAATGAKVQRGTAVGAYAFDRTTATGVAPVTPKTGTAAGAYAFDKTAATGAKTPRGTTTGTYLWARTSATGAVVKSGTTTAGTYAFNRTAATGQRTPKGSTVGGTYTWTGNATGIAPAIGGASGTAIGAYLWARTTGTGTKLTKGTAAGTYVYVGTATGATATPVTVDAATLALSGVTPTGSGSGTASQTLDVAILALTGVDPAATGTGTTSAAGNAAALLLSGVTPTGAGSGAASVTADVAALTLTGVDPTGAVGGGPTSVALDPAILTLAGVDPIGTAGSVATLDTAALLLTGIDPTGAGTGAASVTADVATLTLTAVDVTGSGTSSASVTVDAATLTLTTVTPDAAGTGSSSATSDAAVITLTGVTPTIAASGAAAVTVDVAILVLAGVDVTGTTGTSSGTTLDPAGLLLTGVTPTIAGSGTVAVLADTATLTLVGITPTGAGIGAATPVLVDAAVLTLTGVQLVGVGYVPDPHPADTTVRDLGTATTADFRSRHTLRDARARLTLTDEPTATTVRTLANATTTKENAP